MSRIVAVSPTLADAAQSVGGTLARHAADGHDVVLVVGFEGADTAEHREQVGALLGLAGVVVVDLPGAESRGYGGGYGGVSADDEETQTAIGAALAVTLSRLQPEIVLSPLGLHGHVDARLINDALDHLDVTRLRWLDLPYALHRTPGAPLGAGEVVAVPIGGQLEAKLAACGLLGEVDTTSLRAHATDEAQRLGVGEPVEILLARTASAPSD